MSLFLQEQVHRAAAKGFQRLGGPCPAIVVWLLVGWMVSGAAKGQEPTPTPEEETGLEFFVHSPMPGTPVFGVVEVHVDVLTDQTIQHVELQVDGQSVGRRHRPPYRWTVDLGQDNVAHVLQFSARVDDGQVTTRRVTTGTLRVDDAIDLELQQLFVTATRQGRPFLHLQADDFHIEDEGEVQELVTFERGDVPFTTVLLIDSSLSMAGEALQTALSGAKAFVDGLQPLDRAKVIVFSDHLLASTPFTAEPQEVSRVMATVRPKGGTATHDHLFWALQALDDQQGRKVIILLSDGLDIESVLDMADVAWKADRSATLVYWIRPSSGARPEHDYYSAWRDREAYRREILGLIQLVESSGGTIHDIHTLEEAAQAFRDILSELRQQYVLGYYPSLNLDDGRWHRVRLRVRSNGVRWRTRGGYYDLPRPPRNDASRSRP